MKYVITEQQSERLKKTIWEYLDSHLTPYDGWEAPKSYRNDIRDVGEIFLFLVDTSGEYSTEEHMWYSACDNPNLDDILVEHDCPVVVIPKAKSSALDGFFGDIWKPVFLEWFNYHTKLPIVKVDSEE